MCEHKRLTNYTLLEQEIASFTTIVYVIVIYLRGFTIKSYTFAPQEHKIWNSNSCFLNKWVISQ